MGRLAADRKASRMTPDMPTRLAAAERKAETAQALAIVALVLAARPPRRKSIGARLWDLI